MDEKVFNVDNLKSVSFPTGFTQIMKTERSTIVPEGASIADPKIEEWTPPSSEEQLEDKTMEPSDDTKTSIEPSPANGTSKSTVPTIDVLSVLK